VLSLSQFSRQITEAVLVLVCKRPAPGIGKQRLAARLGNELACAIAQALLVCALEDACSWPGPVVVAPADAADADWAKNLIDPIRLRFPLTIMPQTQGNLGQRLNALDRTLRAHGRKQLVFIGSDAPGLDAIDYQAALAALQHTDVALIPASDGGVVLMASRCAWPELSMLPWSSGQLGKSLLDACESAGQSVSAMRQGRDVDEVADLIELPAALKHDLRPARRLLRELILENLIVIQTAHA
jgi:glycosyltransferase A (GT-A) superfamily protein (DUF2064 family)